MNQKPKPAGGTLIERAAEVYGFKDLLKGGSPAPAAAPVTPAPAALGPDLVSGVGQPQTAPRPGQQSVDVARLKTEGFVVPGAPPSVVSEEFRVAKRGILRAAFGGRDSAPAPKARAVLVCSAKANEGKTFCSVNLALSLANETDIDVLLVDADVAKPEILSTLGLSGSQGLMDALADPSLDPEALVIPTDVPNLSVLPAGRRTNNDTELLASARAHALVEALINHNPRRVVLFDSAPALAASPASALALHVGQVVMVVRADATAESELKEALELLNVGPRLQLLLNGVTFSGSSRKFGSYYGYGE